MVKFINSYVGSKAFWVKHLERYKGRDFVELFCGSAVLSANLAATAILNDLDKPLTEFLNNFDSQIVPDSFTPEDYFRVRKLPDWISYLFCLQSLSFSGVYRYSKNGYNVPIKKKETIYPREKYLAALERWRQLAPKVYNKEYYQLNDSISRDSILISDPPYEKCVAAYNKDIFDYHFYWEYLRLNENICKTIILFDFEENLPFMALNTRKSRINGARAGNSEGLFIFEDSLKEGQKGEELFFSYHKETLEYINKPNKPDFRISKTGDFLELKSDYYDSTRTENFFFERYSDKVAKTPGGPWKALEMDSTWFVYFFVKNKEVYIFKTLELLKHLEACDEKDLIDIPNKGWITSGYKVKRNNLEKIFVKRLLN